MQKKTKCLFFCLYKHSQFSSFYYSSQENKRRCGRTEIIFPAEEKEYIEKRS
ncbi:hypothetical protein GHI08_16515, partial [Enterococcus faecium]|nr:hypothetical protein [Enterococcus faecium]